MTITSIVRPRAGKDRRHRRFWSRKRIRRTVLLICLLIATAILAYAAASRASGAALGAIPVGKN